MLRRMKAFDTRPYCIVIPPYFNGESFVYPGTVVIPSHCEYSINDLQSAGLLSSVPTTILHDDAVVISNVSSLSDNNASPSYVPSDNDNS